MRHLEQLQQQLQHQDLPPVLSWSPPFCGDIPIFIDHNGQWFYQNSPITRQALVTLFAKVLIQQDGAYYLQTPVEKVRIQVADAPFIITDWHWQPTAVGAQLHLCTNLAQQVIVSPQYPLFLKPDPQQQLLPYVALWHGLSAKLSRNVYYQLAEYAEAVYCNQQQHYQIKSAAYPFTLAIA